ncbi:50S ribosomal protein L10 [Candidatus Woesearchaeota archaeon]|jgi:large subunit ribosomal protein L10|nr:50S ribosomal protein L10 [Candidatus Woesearchaeota archaeon]MBT3538311.1 50S ribosomal protein L10 [Candidatus Woesearchaeota archaeon]MBT4696695.1 50S ribosomal protein L10 [Candidatus Woesearchaeota archaeon]MBT4716813.1 50S ribosomal protein L10 [Candidatus Woesearchaeota archaeon]MBT7105980.1 50S ribosomal protein L10 [Candidatus Woesearchaeota archaeon]
MAHVCKAKKEIVAKYTKLIEEYPIVAAINMEGLPAPQLQNMRATLRKQGVVLFMNKRRLITIAIEAAKDKKKGIEKLIPSLKGMPALLFSKENPFKLFKTLEKSKSPAPAKAGQTAPKDIVIPAGPTGFAPGPIISELGGVGIKAGIDAGKVVIKEDSNVAKEGDVISVQLASILTRLGVTPMEIGLDLTAAYEDGFIYDKKILAVDEEEYIGNVSQASSWAFNLAMFAGIPTSTTTEPLIQKAFRDAKALAISESILADGVTEEIIAKAHAQMNSVASQLPDEAKSEELKNVKAPTVQPAAAAQPEKTQDDKKPEEEKPVENAAAGLGSLFG